jgi:hypothetical protein
MIVFGFGRSFIIAVVFEIHDIISVLGSISYDITPGIGNAW